LPPEWFWTDGSSKIIEANVLDFSDFLKQALRSHEARRTRVCLSAETQRERVS